MMNRNLKNIFPLIVALAYSINVAVFPELVTALILMFLLLSSIKICSFVCSIYLKKILTFRSPKYPEESLLKRIQH